MSCRFKAGNDLSLFLLLTYITHPLIKEVKSLVCVAKFQQPGQLEPSVIKGSCIVGLFPIVNSNDQSLKFDLRNLSFVYFSYRDAPHLLVLCLLSG
jgi:hypothetical protein